MECIVGTQSIEDQVSFRGCRTPWLSQPVVMALGGFPSKKWSCGSLEEGNNQLLGAKSETARNRREELAKEKQAGKGSMQNNLGYQGVRPFGQMLFLLRIYTPKDK